MWACTLNEIYLQFGILHGTLYFIFVEITMLREHAEYVKVGNNQPRLATEPPEHGEPIKVGQKLPQFAIEPTKNCSNLLFI